MFLSFSGWGFQTPWLDEFWLGFVAIRVGILIHACTITYTQVLPSYQTHLHIWHTICTPHHMHIYTTHTHITHTQDFSTNAAHTPHHTYLSHTKHLSSTLHKCSLATGYPRPNFQLSLPDYCISGTPSLALLEHAKYTPVFASAVSSAEFLFPGLNFPGLLSFPQKALPWPHNQSSTQIFVLSQMEKKLVPNYTNHSFIQQISS